MMTLDRNDPEMREAIDQAARVSEWLLERSNSDADRALALSILGDFVSELLVYRFPKRRERAERLAWALILTERRTDLQPHQEKLLELAWERVREDALQREWEQLGGAR